MLANFEALETFEITSINSTNPARATVVSWLNDMLGFSSWISIVPSLQKVLIYGLHLE